MKNSLKKIGLLAAAVAIFGAADGMDKLQLHNKTFSQLDANLQKIYAAPKDATSTDAVLEISAEAMKARNAVATLNLIRGIASVDGLLQLGGTAVMLSDLQSYLEDQVKTHLAGQLDKKKEMKAKIKAKTHPEYVPSAATEALFNAGMTFWNTIKNIETSLIVSDISDADPNQYQDGAVYGLSHPQIKMLREGLKSNADLWTQKIDGVKGLTEEGAKKALFDGTGLLGELYGKADSEFPYSTFDDALYNAEDVALVKKSEEDAKQNLSTATSERDELKTKVEDLTFQLSTKKKVIEDAKQALTELARLRDENQRLTQQLQGMSPGNTPEEKTKQFKLLSVDPDVVREMKRLKGSN